MEGIRKKGAQKDCSTVRRKKIKDPNGGGIEVKRERKEKEGGIAWE